MSAVYLSHNYQLYVKFFDNLNSKMEYMKNILHLFHEVQLNLYLGCEDLRERNFLMRAMRQPSTKPPPTMAARVVIMEVVVENIGW